MEIELKLGDQRAVVASEGASLRRYFAIGAEGSVRDIVWGYSAGEPKKGGQGDVLIPFPGRITDGIYSFGGERFQLERNDKESPSAIHGFLRAVEWNVEERSDSSVRFRVQMHAHEYGPKGYPFSLAVQVSYALESSGLVCRFSIRNIGNSPAPVGVGFHPYFTVGTELIDDAEVRIPASTMLEFGQGFIPTGRILPVEGTDLDFRQARRIGKTRINTCFADISRDPDGLAWVILSNPATAKRVRLWMDEAFRYIVAYTGDAIQAPDARRALAIEPMTCATDAFNHPEWGLVSLAPDAEMVGRYGVNPDTSPAP